MIINGFDKGCKILPVTHVNDQDQLIDIYIYIVKPVLKGELLDK
jgi:hypothetical protein